MMSTQQAAEYGNISGGFSAHPKVVSQKPKFKDPYGRGGEQFENQNPGDYHPQNIMHDKRVVRGSTHAAMVIPAGTYPENLFGSTGKSKSGKKKTIKQKTQPADEFFTRDIKTPEPLAGRQNIDIQTDQFVDELTDKAPKYEIGSQTDFLIDRPPTPHSIPTKRGRDMKTLVEDNELFIFDHDVEPILSVLCGKTLESARMEVLEEEELKVMKEQQKHFEDVKNAENLEAQRMEQAEQRKLQEFERRKLNEREKKKNKVAAHRKIVSRVLAKKYVHGMKDYSYRYLSDTGFFTNTRQVVVLEQNVLPWLTKKVEKFVKQLDEFNKFPDTLMLDYFEDSQEVHQKTVWAEKARKDNVRQQEEEQLRQKLEEKMKRKAAREAQRKANELKKLKEEIFTKFIQKGEQREHILGQDMVEINGNYQKVGCVGGLGGMIGQIILCFSGIHKKWKKEIDITNPRIVQNFLFLYIDTKMRTEKLHLQVGKAFEDFLNGLEKPLQLNEMRVMKEANYTKFRQIISDPYLYGDGIMSIMKTQAKQLKLSVKAYDQVYEGLWDLYCKKPQTLDLNAKKLEGFLARIKLTVPPQDVVDEEGNVTPSCVSLPLRAIVRIRIPLKRPVDENNTQQDDEENEEKTDQTQKNVDAKDQKLWQSPPNTERVYEEVEIDDKVTLINTISDNCQIWVLHQAAQRWLRKDILQAMKKNIKELDIVDLDDVIQQVEAHAAEVESNFVKSFSEQADEQQRVPVFDFELN